MLDSWFFCYTSSIIHYQYHRTLIKFIILWLNKSYISLSNVYTRIYDRRLGCYFLQNHDCTGTSIKYKKGKKLNKQYSNVKLTVLSFTRVYKKWYRSRRVPEHRKQRIRNYSSIWIIGFHLFRLKLVFNSVQIAEY